jgi:hypothetical protein
MRPTGRAQRQSGGEEGGRRQRASGADESEGEMYRPPNDVRAQLAGV